MPRLVADLDAAQPLDADIAFPARHQKTQRIALLGPQRLAVLRIDYEAIVEAFLQRQAAVHVRTVGAFDHCPLRFLLDADFLEQGRELHASPFRATDHAVVELQRVELRRAPLHAAVGGTLDEVNARHRREADNVLHRQQQRTFDEAMDHQLVLLRIDVGAAGMIALEKQPVRRDDAVEVLQRREADGRFGARGKPRNVAADDAGLELRRVAIGPVHHAGAERLRPRRIRRRRRAFALRQRRVAAERDGAGESRTEA